MIVVVCRRCRPDYAGATHVAEVRGEQRAEIDVIADHTDDHRHVVVQRNEYRLVTVGPRSSKVFQRDVIEVLVVHRRVGRCHRIASCDLVFHGLQHGIGRRHPGEPVVNALRLFARPGIGGCHEPCQQHPDERDLPRADYSCKPAGKLIFRVCRIFHNDSAHACIRTKTSPPPVACDG